MAAATRVIELVGREAELGKLRAFLDLAGPARALVFAGEPGIGKSSLWEAGIDLARSSGTRVLAARASEAEAKHSFAGLIDLLDGVTDPELAALPPPQLGALQVVLLRAELGTIPPAEHAIPLGLLNALRQLSQSAPVLVAIDDLQWLDAPSAQALTYVARRLQPDGVTFLLARRPGRPTQVERALEQLGLETVEVVPLSIAALRRLLAERAGLTLTRHLLRRIADATLGNPLFALELGQMLVEEGVPAAGEELPVPESVEELLSSRIRRLSPALRRLLLAVALSAGMRTEDAAAFSGQETVEEAVSSGLLVVETGRLRVSHPLVAAAARKRARTRERREVHLALARVVTDDELRARHLALAADGPDEALAQTLETAAAATWGRGARQEAAELGEWALRLTPAGSRARGERVLSVASYLIVAGEPRRATELLIPELDSLPAGKDRARAYLLLADGYVKGNDDILRYLELALEESADDPGTRANVLAVTVDNLAVTRVERIADAESLAEEAIPAARRGGTDVELEVVGALAWARALRGVPIDDLCSRASELSAFSPIAWLPDRVLAQRLVWRGEVDRARALLARLWKAADERGEPYSYALLRLHVCELELRVGNWDAAQQVLDEWASEQETLPWPMSERCRALLAVGRGETGKARPLAVEAIGRAEDLGIRWDLLEALRALGVTALLEHDPDSAADCFRAVWEHTEREGVSEPGVFPVAPDLVEALTELGEDDEARAVGERLQALAERLEHPWALAAAKRCRGELEEAAADFDRLGLHFDRARTLLLLGRTARRRRQWAAARRALEDAAAAFDRLGSPGWADDARAELARVGGRQAKSDGSLTPSERRTTELAAEGLSNKEIARTLFVTVHTVEAHLSRAYAKLGVRKRAQLAARLKE